MRVFVGTELVPGETTRPSSSKPYKTRGFTRNSRVWIEDWCYPGAEAVQEFNQLWYKSKVKVLLEDGKQLLGCHS